MRRDNNNILEHHTFEFEGTAGMESKKEIKNVLYIRYVLLFAPDD